MFTLCALELAYVVAGNGLIWWVLREQVNKDPETCLSYGTAYSILPTVVHVADLRVANHDSHVEWAITAKHATFTIDFRALLHQKFHTSRLRADGVVFHFRQRLTAEGADDPRSLMLPAVPPFADPPLIPIKAPAPPLTDANYDLWTAQLDDVDARIDEVWVGPFRCVGPARVRGGFFFKPLRMMVLAPTRADLDGIDVNVAEQGLAHDVRGRVDLAIGAYDPREGVDTMTRALSTTARLEGQVPSIAALAPLWPVHHQPALQGGSGQFMIDARIEGGRLQPGSVVRYETDDAGAAIGPVKVSGGGAVDVRAVRGGVDGRVEVDVDVRRASIRRGRVRPAFAAGNLAVRGLDADLVGPHAPEGWAEGWVRVPDLRWILDDGRARAADDFQISGGDGWAAGRIDVAANGVARAEVRAGARKAAFVWQDGRATLDLRARASADGIDAKTTSGRVRSASVTAESVEFARGGSPTNGYAHLDVKSLLLTQGRVEDVDADADVRLSNIGALFGRAVAGATFAIDAGAGRANAHVTRKAAGGIRGEVKASVAAADLRLAKSRLFADVGAAFTVESNAELSAAVVRGGRVTLRNAGVAPTKQGETIDRSWWADVNLTSLEIGAAKGVAVDVKATGRFRDGRLPMALLDQAGVVPGWARSVFTLDGLGANGEVRSDASGLMVRFGAAGDGGSAHGALIDKGRGLGGDVLVQSGILKAGVEVRNGKTHVSLFSGEGWLRERISELAMRP